MSRRARAWAGAAAAKRLSLLERLPDGDDDLQDDDGQAFDGHDKQLPDDTGSRDSQGDRAWCP